MMCVQRLLWLRKYDFQTRKKKSSTIIFSVLAMMLLLASTEHVLVLIAFLCPPVLLTVALIVILATFGKSLGLRERYIKALLVGVVRERPSSTEKLLNGRGWQAVNDSLYFLKAGMEAIIEDEVTTRFEAEQLASWNMLTRTSITFYQFISWKLTLLWGVGCLFRYLFLLPLRVLLFSIGMLLLVFTTAAIGVVPNCGIKRWLNEKCVLMCFRILSRSVSALIYFHDLENKAKNGGICVANHTSPIDVMILSTDNTYALIGQRHDGVLGLLQRALSRASSHIWFERSEAGDRAAVTSTLREHVEDPNKLPILIFPEGTCINNTSVMMFKKGSFEVGTKIYPIA
uniref:Phospholipid/glycerol acyltransferase domain-containing protein n=1 Tax=Ditylenchus dipsaci TaxID=166011 RepID=A0A915DSP1_9BILA